MSKLIVFDVDGTILDSAGLMDRVLRHYSDERGMPLPCLDTVRIGYHAPHEYDFKWGLKREEQKKHLYDAFDIADEWSVSNDPEKTPLLFEGVKEALLLLKNQGHTLAIVTSKSEDPLLHLLEYHGVSGLFSAHRNRTDVARRGEPEKPHPDQLASVMRELNFKPADTLMVGDTTMDIHMGRAASALTLGVAWGLHPVDKLHDAGAHAVADTHFSDVMIRMRRLFSLD